MTGTARTAAREVVAAAKRAALELSAVQTAAREQIAADRARDAEARKAKEQRRASDEWTAPSSKEIA